MSNPQTSYILTPTKTLNVEVLPPNSVAIDSSAVANNVLAALATSVSLANAEFVTDAVPMLDSCSAPILWCHNDDVVEDVSFATELGDILTSVMSGIFPQRSFSKHSSLDMNDTAIVNSLADRTSEQDGFLTAIYDNFALGEAMNGFYAGIRGMSPESSSSVYYGARSSYTGPCGTTLYDVFKKVIDDAYFGNLNLDPNNIFDQKFYDGVKTCLMSLSSELALNGFLVIEGNYVSIPHAGYLTYAFTVKRGEKVGMVGVSLVSLAALIYYRSLA